MKFNVCPPECKGPFADIAASRAAPHSVPNYGARDEQRLESVLQRLNDGSQQPAAPASQMPRYTHAPRQTWPPPKPRNRGVRASEPPPSITRAPQSSNSFSYPAVHSAHAPGHYRGGGPSAQRPTLPRPSFPVPPSHGAIAPASGTDTKRVSST